MKAQTSTIIGVVATLALLLVLGFTVAAVAQELPVLATLSQASVGSIGQEADLAHSPALTVTHAFTIYVPSVLKAPPPKYALKFDGADDFASIVDKGDFDFDQTLTLEAWVKPLSLSSSELWHRDILSGSMVEPPSLGLGSGRWGLQRSSVAGDSTRWNFYVCPTPNYCWGPGSDPLSLHPGRWDHLAGTYDGSQLVIFQNGELVRDSAHSGGLLEVDFVILGRGYKPFHGLIDEVRVWSIARSQAEIQANMHRTLRGDEPGLVGYWRLDEGSGQAILDSSPHHNDGRLGASLGEDGSDPTWVLSDAPIQ